MMNDKEREYYEEYLNMNKEALKRGDPQYMRPAILRMCKHMAFLRHQVEVYKGMVTDLQEFVKTLKYTKEKN